MTETEGIAERRAAVGRVLASAEFQASSQARHFLEYVTGRLFSGAPQVDQTDIARHVLERGDDFDPTTDASVRKLAMQVRQRLERYYAGPGADEPTILVLPLRSYVPQFHSRTPATTPPDEEPVPKRRRWLPATIASGAVVMAGLLWWAMPGSAPPPDTRVRILTQRGDITSPRPDNAPGSLRLFGELGANEDLVAQLTFRPDHERQHAGIVIWGGARRFVSLARRFSSRNYVTFGYEYDNYIADHPVSEVEDPDAQAGRPLWLRLRRAANTYTAYTSADGREWRLVGEPLRLPNDLRRPRSGIFAVNGRRESPSIPADFEFASSGLVLPAAAGDGPWKFESACEGGPDIFAGFRGTPGAPPCYATWWRPAPPGEWTLSTRIEVAAHPALATGLMARFPNGRVRILRYPSDLPTISLVRDGISLESIPDFPGSPPVYLCLTLHGGRIEGSASVDGRAYRTIGRGIAAAALGNAESVGLVANRRPGKEESPLPPLHVYFVGLLPGKLK